MSYDAIFMHLHSAVVVGPIKEINPCAVIQTSKTPWLRRKFHFIFLG